MVGGEEAVFCLGEAVVSFFPDQTAINSGLVWMEGAKFFFGPTHLLCLKAGQPDYRYLSF